MKLIMLAAIAAFALPSVASAADAKVVRADGIDGSKIEFFFGRNGSFLTRSQHVALTRVCEKSGGTAEKPEYRCGTPQIYESAGPGVVETLASPLSFIAGMRALRPPKGDSTYVSNDSSSRSQAEGGNARSDAFVDQSFDGSTTLDFWGNEGSVGIFLPAPPPAPPPPPPPPPIPGEKG